MYLECFAHGQLHILNVIFRLTAVCETAMSNKKDKLNVQNVYSLSGCGGKCFQGMRTIKERGESAV